MCLIKKYFLLIFLFPYIFVQPAHAFTLMADGLKGWPKTSITFLVNASACSLPADELTAAIDNAVAIWNAVPTSNIKITRGDSTTLTGLNTDPVIECSTTFGSTSTVGTGSFSYDSENIIQQGRVLLNSQSGSAGDISTKSATVLSIILAHEIGHVLGLGHSATEAALMHYSVGQKASLRLSQDDIDGISFLYPRDELSKDGIFGCGSLVLLSGGDGDDFHKPSAGFFIFLAVLGLISIAFRTRHSRAKI